MFLAACSGECSVRVWKMDQKSLDLVQTIVLPSKKTPISIEFLDVCQEIALIAVGCTDGMIRLFDWKKGTLVEELSGHENWVSGLTFSRSLSRLASCDQDGYIRIWKFEVSEESKQDTVEIMAAVIRPEEVSASINVTVDSVIIAHEDWVMDISWAGPSILSASMDQTIALWAYDAESKLWLSDSRVGVVGGRNKLGFVSAASNFEGSDLVGITASGSLHRWCKRDEDRWESTLCSSGHCKGVRDLCWAPGGEYFLSVSLDQTTRMFAFWKDLKLWREIARPQVHGYDMSCVAVIPGVAFRFASGAEEKVIRIFDAPSHVVSTFKSITGFEFEQTISRGDKVVIPELGLSNKSFDSLLASKEEKEIALEQDESPGIEEYLRRQSLFVESQKLYGHGYEVFSIASSHSGKLLASSNVAKQSQSDHATIRLWDTERWIQTHQLVGHQLTIAQLAFSHDDRFLLSVSRDRSLCVFDVTLDPPQLVFTAKAHSRIIWSCCWTRDDKYFATGSRDKKVLIWNRLSWKQDSCLPMFSDAITAIAFAPCSIDSEYVLAVGLESGVIQLWKGICSEEGMSWKCSDMSRNMIRFYHTGTITRLSWSPRVSSSGIALLASCGEDFSVRLFQVNLKLI